MKTVIELDSVAKTYGKSIVALRNLSFKVREGSLVGFVGPNGAGKTTTLKILTGLLAPSSGKAYVDGHDVSHDLTGVRKTIGYLPQDFGVYPFMRVDQYLYHVSRFYMTGAARDDAVREAIESVGLSHLSRRKISTLSTGERQRLGIAQSLIHGPRVLLLDEPTSSLDPIGRREIYSVIRQLAKSGKTVVISSHILAELVKVITDIVVIRSGALLFSGTVDQLQRHLQHGKRDYIRLVFDVLDDSLPKQIEQLQSVDSVTRVQSNELTVHANDVDRARMDVVRLVASSNSILSSLTSGLGDLEDLIVDMITHDRPIQHGGA
ncbi:MAG: ABC transporter ATP-binding protein [Candidatus Thorarchaeota archaeon]